MSKFVDCEHCGINYNADTFNEDNPHKCLPFELRRNVASLKEMLRSAFTELSHAEMYASRPSMRGLIVEIESHCRPTEQVERDQ